MTFKYFCELTAQDLKIEQILKSNFLLPDCGAVASFLGTTRATSTDSSGVLRLVTHLEYTSYTPLALKQMAQIANEMQKLYPPVKSPHRKDALKALEWGLDAVKKRVAVFKKEVYGDDHVDVDQNQSARVKWEWRDNQGDTCTNNNMHEK